MTTTEITPLIVRKGENRLNRTLNLYGDLIDIKVHGRDTGDRSATFEGHIAPEVGPPLHMHTREDETFYVLEGTFRFEVGGELYIAHAGDTVFAPRGIPHTFQNAGDTPGRLLTTVQPAGLERFFEEMDGASAGPADMSVVVPIFEKYGLELLGPPLAARGQAAHA